MGNGLINLLFAVVGTLLIVVVSHQLWSGVNEQYDIEVAMEYSSADTVTFKGVFIRDEEVVSRAYSGVLSYAVTDGGKVAKDSVVAYVYNSEEEIETNRRIKETEHEIELLRDAQNPGTVQTAKPEFISSLISEEYQTIAALLAKGETEDLSAHKDQLFTLMCIYQIAVKQETGYDEKIAELSAKEAQLRVQKKDYKEAFYSPDSGYFVSYTDGFENELSFDNAINIDAATIDNVIKHDSGSGRKNGVIGKLIKGYNWKIAGIIDNSSNVFNMGDKVRLDFASVPDSVTATIERLDDLDTGKTIAVLRCDEITYNLVKLRTDRVEMTLHDFDGIKVPKEALRFNRKNEKGCYVLWGQRVLFKKIDEIYETEDYILSKLTSDENYVCVYDNVIKSGVDTAAYYASNEEPEEPEETQTAAAGQETDSSPPEDNGSPPEKNGGDDEEEKDGEDGADSEDGDSAEGDAGTEDEEEPSGEENEDEGPESGSDGASEDSSGGDIHFE
ncbi:MAG: hypothetical protein J6F31_09225 [Oscillospiraceae bacterium]|nr:hypothetical protein [Oscillospiraceae bacterium]